MNIVYAAEKPSIASIFSEYLQREVSPTEIRVADNPDETGSFLIHWRFDRYILSPSGAVAADSLLLAE